MTAANHQRSKSISKLPSGIKTDVDHQLNSGNPLYDRNSRLVSSLDGCLKGPNEKLTSTDHVEEHSNQNLDQVSNGSQHYLEEWERLFKDSDFIAVLKKNGVDGTLRNSRFRSICWRVYLECLSEDQEIWIKETIEARQRYSKLKEMFLTNPRLHFEADLLHNNPLSQDENSPWNRFFQDSELKVTIRQDVIRTFPEIEFFHSHAIRDMMVNVLFCYAREYPQMSYKQGMHELLAPIIFVLHSDHQAFLHAMEIELVEDAVKILLDPSYIEHDAFFMFSQIMEVVEPWYLVKEMYSSKIETINERPFARPQDLHPTNVIIIKLTRIHDQYLKRHDPDLFHHLERLEIAPQIYGIRWLRLLFGREFPLQDLLVVWDVIFADSMTFDLVDYIFISMLIFIRDLLLCSDYAASLTHLMRYPAVTDVQYIIDMSLHMRDPQHYSKPVGYSVQMLQHIPTVGGRAEIHRAPLRNNSTESLREHSKTTLPQKSSSKMLSGFSTLTRKMASRPRSLAINNPDLVETAKAFSEPTTFESRSPSPTLTEYCQNKKDRILLESSTSSLKLETELQTMNRSSRNKVESDPTNGSDEPFPGSPGKILNRKGSWSFKWNKELKVKGEAIDPTYLLGQLNEIQAMCTYCSQKMTLHIDRLQECVLRQHLENEDEMLIALAGLKQVRDILKGTLKFSQNLLDGDDIIISDNHYPEEPKHEDLSEQDNNCNETNTTQLDEEFSSVSQNYESFQEIDLDIAELCILKAE